MSPTVGSFSAFVLAATLGFGRVALADGPLYHDAHFHVQDFVASGPPVPEILDMMGSRVGRSVMMSVGITVAHDPLADGPYRPQYYTQTEADDLYYNAIQDVMVAHKFLALPAADRARLDPLMNAFNIKDSRAGDYIRQMVRLYPGVWSGFGEIHLKKEDFSSKIAGGAPSLFSPALDEVLDAIAEMGAAVVVHCDIDTPGTLSLVNSPLAKVIFGDAAPRPQYLDAVKALLGRHPGATVIWAHFMGLGRRVGAYPDHWDMLEDILADPAFAHVQFDISWGSVLAAYLLDTPEHLQRTADLLRRFPDRFLYGSDQGATTDWDLVLQSYEVWNPLWAALGPEITRRITRQNYVRIWDRSRQNIRAWEAKQPPVR